MTAHPGRLVALEGIDGCGKSTQAARLAARLGAVLTHEPGATALGSRLRELLLGTGGPPLGDRTEALLMAADRAQHVEEVIRPSLLAGRWVVTDRYSGSTLAYQGFGRGLDPDGLETLVTWAAGGTTPDLTILVDIEPEVALRRRTELESVRSAGGARADRLEQLDHTFFERVREGFLILADDDPRGWVVVDGSSGIDDLALEIEQLVMDRLGIPPGFGATDGATIGDPR